MDVSDWISLIGALASLVLTIVIAVVQYKQSKKIASMERAWDERDERRRVQEVKASAVSFISRYYVDRELISLVCNSRYVQSPPLLFAADVP